MPHQPPNSSRDLTELLSEVYNADRQANDPRTRDFLEAGKRLLSDDLLRDPGSADAEGRPPFEELLAWLTRRRILEEAQHAREQSRGEGTHCDLTEAAFRYRWRSQAGYLRDLVIWALCPRMERPDEIACAYRIIDDAANAEKNLTDAIAEIAAEEVQALTENQAFRMQMIFQAALAHDPRVADALHRIDRANVEAWTEFARRGYAKLGLEPRKDISFELIGCALHAAGEGVMFRAMLAQRPGNTTPAPADLLALIAKALVIATADPGNGQALDDALNQFIASRHQDHALRLVRAGLTRCAGRRAAWPSAPDFLVVPDFPCYRGCRTTTCPALSSRTLSTIAPRSDRPGRTFALFRVRIWGLTTSTEESPDSLYHAENPAQMENPPR
jgi:hypothetical protein